MYINHMIRILSFLLLWTTLGANAESPWQLIKEKGGTQIYATQKLNYKLKHHKAITRINKNLDTVLAALQDTDACADWVYQCISNRMVSMMDVSQRVYHTTIDTPLWFKNRDFYLESDVVYDSANKQFIISLTSRPDYAAIDKDAVRVAEVAMVWELKSIEEDLTEVIYEVYIDPKLPIKSINHQMIRRSTFRTIQGLKKLVKKPQ